MSVTVFTVNSDVARANEEKKEEEENVTSPFESQSSVRARICCRRVFAAGFR